MDEAGTPAGTGGQAGPGTAMMVPPAADRALPAAARRAAMGSAGAAGIFAGSVVRSAVAEPTAGWVVAMAGAVLGLVAVVAAVRRNRALQAELDRQLEEADGYRQESALAAAAYRRFSLGLWYWGAALFTAISLLNLVLPAPAQAFIFWVVGALMMFLGFPTAGRQHNYLSGARARKLGGDV